MAFRHDQRALTGASCLAGFALGGFFDGIVLHQILQWHHLLSGVDAAPLADLRMQVLADGLFHALMYVIGLIGLLMLWKRRAALALPRAGRHLMTWVLAGFGGWHVIDALLSHWLLGLHRIRQDAVQPLLWDIGWLAVFGLLPLAAAWRIGTRNGGEPPPGSTTSAADSESGNGAGSDLRGSQATAARSCAWAVALLTLSAGVWSLRPPSDTSQAVIVFRPDISTAQAFDALGAVDARLLWVDGSGDVWAVQGLESSARTALYWRGALFVSGGMSLAGCANWSSSAARNSSDL